MASREELFNNPLHPYTRALLDVVPHANLDHPLDFDRLTREMVTEGQDWGDQFISKEDGADMEMLKINEDHSILVASGTDIKQLGGSMMSKYAISFGKLLGLIVALGLFGTGTCASRAT